MGLAKAIANNPMTVSLGFGFLIYVIIVTITIASAEAHALEEGQKAKTKKVYSHDDPFLPWYADKVTFLAKDERYSGQTFNAFFEGMMAHGFTMLLSLIIGYVLMFITGAFIAGSLPVKANSSGQPLISSSKMM